jgi:hypothetical protein
VSFFTEIQPRISYSEGELATFVARLAPLYHINSHNTLGGGFLWQPTYLPSASNELRLFLQYIYSHGVGESASFIHRIRFEHRDINTTVDKAYRVRYQLRTLHSWFDNSNLRALLSNEIFFNLNTTSVSGPVSGFDQNRIYIGFNYQWNKHLNSDFSYLYNYVRRPRAVDDRNLHVFFYGLNASF